MSDSPTTTTLGERLEAARQGLQPAPSFRALERRLVTRIGEYAPSSETLRRWHRPQTTEQDVDLVILTCLAEVYGTTVRELSESAANLLSDLGMNASGWLSGMAELAA
jgi:hypothetical protein